MSEAGASRAIVVGASGGIGAALALALEARGHHVARLARHPADSATLALDLEREDSIAAAAAALAGQAPFATIVVATGLLHEARTRPEKALRDLDPGALDTYFRVNATGPALVAKHFVPLLPKRGRSLFAALSARVGSIGDNRLGGWYGYRASKAALNMLVRTLSIELQRTRPDCVCVTLHPGTVDTRLSAPFQRGVAAERLFDPERAAAQLLAVLDGLTPADSGGCWDWEGRPVPP
ncbi:SDR family NAD(P)-dependent oxidoreductase [Sphingomonas ginkgonis]|uniref:SDR family NAD(P)-dependent oxidoreductase n=1 Tax=Sphingomonas ginkgonis TaxID=2315330 RepID=A0A429VB35_9SPHN|nr:SDR family NAD(P)-dependent oxidoreductase [Sphingomonas ginkgonis]RST31213.1 SDR family NAD(P)-dependent oxidoreductase [Sphingomonas ginkgonis]